jgi:hypothetical protein
LKDVIDSPALTSHIFLPAQCRLVVGTDLSSNFFSFFLYDSSVANPDPGSRAFLTPGSGTGFFLDPRSRILVPESHNCIFESLSDSSFGRK